MSFVALRRFKMCSPKSLGECPKKNESGAISFKVPGAFLPDQVIYLSIPSTRALSLLFSYLHFFFRWRRITYGGPESE